MPILRNGLADAKTLDDRIRAGEFTALSENAFAILNVSPDVAYQNILQTIHTRLPLRVIGGTSLGDPFIGVDDEFVTTLTAFDRPGWRLGMAVSDPLSDTTGRSEMQALHDRAVADLGCPVKFFLILLPIVPHCYVDPFLEELFDIMGETPVFGGMVSDESDQQNFKLFADGQAYRDRLALLALGGDIEPVFGFGNQVTMPHSFSPLVTAARGNVVSGLDGIGFVEYLEKIEFDIGGIKEILREMPIPIHIHYPASMNRLERVTLLTRLDDSGAGVLSATVPPGSHIHFCLLTRDDIQASTEQATKQLLDAMQKKAQNGYHFTTIMAMSSAARYYVMAASEWIEADLLRQLVQPGFCAFGCYATKEICPVSTASGTRINGIHTQSLALCAF